MKKLLALLLVLAILVPMSLVATADEPEEVTVEPFFMFNWSEIPEGKFDNVYSSPFFWTAERVGLKISWNGANTPKDLAVKTKALFDTRPAGARYIKFGFPPRIYMMANMENYVYLDKGVDMLIPWFDEFLREYKALGGELDGVILDTEIVDMNSYYLHRDAVEDVELYDKIVNDPRYATEIRPLLVERGFPFYENVAKYTPEIYSISRNLTGTKYSEARAIWDRVMRNRIAGYLDECVCQPLWKYYPEALVSDYQSADRAGWFKFLSDTGDNSFGELTASGGNAIKVGNTSNHNVYHSRPSDDFYKDSKGQPVYKNPYSYYEAVYEQSGFNMALWEINQFKNIYASTDNRKISAWLTSYNYGIKENGSAYTPYTTEIVYHLGMLNPQPFLGYVVDTECTDVPYYDRLGVISQQLAELTRVAGYSDRQPIEIPANWNESFLLSGMYANGRNIWRITPDTTKIGLEYFQIDGKDPTFRVSGKTITFPGGKIIEDSKINDVGSCGFWVETAKDVTPIVTTDTYRFEQYPSLLINFDNLKEGAFDYNTSDPAGAWKLTWNKKQGPSETNIVVNGDGKALSVTGTVITDSILLPENITAGDSYAKDQSWEISLTIPEGLSADAEINVLGYSGQKQKATDDGFKIKGGKVYYAQLCEDKTQVRYVELMDIQPGTYTFKRTMNFHNPELFGSSYYVFGSEGCLAMVENKAAPVFTSITSIKFSTTGVDKAILLDNYKITITGAAAADFELYDARTGIPVKDLETPRAESTAYRLSWLNATETEKLATIKAAFYADGVLKEEKVIKEVKMLPGCDFVETGIVEVPEGQNVKVYVTTDLQAPQVNLELTQPESVPTDPTDPTTPAGGDKTGKGDSTMIIILVVVAVVVVGGVVAALMLTKKKKPAKPEEKPEENTEE